jgi:hypothetical protein
VTLTDGQVFGYSEGISPFGENVVSISGGQGDLRVSGTLGYSADTGEALARIEGKVVCIWSRKEQVSRQRWQLTDKRYYATFQQLDQIATPVYQEVFNRATPGYPAQQVVVRGIEFP